jgi:hypothetical protein
MGSVVIDAPHLHVALDLCVDGQHLKREPIPVSEDPVAGRYAKPLSLLEYLYGLDNPITLTDPTGEAATDADGSTNAEAAKQRYQGWRAQPQSTGAGVATTSPYQWRVYEMQSRPPETGSSGPSADQLKALEAAKILETIASFSGDRHSDELLFFAGIGEGGGRFKAWGSSVNVNVKGTTVSLRGDYRPSRGAMFFKGYDASIRMSLGPISELNSGGGDIYIDATVIGEEEDYWLGFGGWDQEVSGSGVTWKGDIPSWIGNPEEVQFRGAIVNDLAGGLSQPISDAFGWSTYAVRVFPYGVAHGHQ